MGLQANLHACALALLTLHSTGSPPSPIPVVADRGFPKLMRVRRLDSPAHFPPACALAVPTRGSTFLAEVSGDHPCATPSDRVCSCPSNEVGLWGYTGCVAAVQREASGSFATSLPRKGLQWLNTLTNSDDNNNACTATQRNAAYCRAGAVLRD